MEDGTIENTVIVTEEDEIEMTPMSPESAKKRQKWRMKSRRTMIFETSQNLLTNLQNGTMAINNEIKQLEKVI